MYRHNYFNLSNIKLGKAPKVRPLYFAINHTIMHDNYFNLSNIKLGKAPKVRPLYFAINHTIMHDNYFNLSNIVSKYNIKTFALLIC
jgi:hypothetical protein